MNITPVAMTPKFCANKLNTKDENNKKAKDEQIVNNLNNLKIDENTSVNEIFEAVGTDIRFTPTQAAAATGVASFGLFALVDNVLTRGAKSLFKLDLGKPNSKMNLMINGAFSAYAAYSTYKNEKKHQ
ncbi:MAG: hypothetical protein R3Y28_04455 [Candidatus Gastranaerophilales bacterium]